MLNFLKSKSALIATVFILAQAGLLYSAYRPEVTPAAHPLSILSKQLENWRMVQESEIDAESQEVLKADDLLNRVYTNGKTPANLFVAAFQSQRSGKAPHSPKNCLPGSGWTPVVSDHFSIDLGGGTPIVVNRYIVAHGDERSLVLYWYQSRDRAIASEYEAKFWVVYDAMRLNRTDTALVRVVVPVINKDEDAATKEASDFVRAFYGSLRQILPS